MKNYVWWKRNFFDETILLLFGAAADSSANKLKKIYKINPNKSITINQIYQIQNPSFAEKIQLLNHTNQNKNELRKSAENEIS